MIGTLRYAGWMLRDLGRGAGAVMLGVAALTAFAVSRFPAPPSDPIAARQVLSLIVGQAALPFVLLATGGLVSSDLRNGYYRGLFSKPVDAAIFYLQRWLLGALVVAASVPLLAVAIGIGVGTVPFRWSLVANLELLYLLLGGLVFFLSTFVRRDWLFALVVFLLQTVMHGLSSGGLTFGPVAGAIYTVLPPFHLLELGAPPPQGANLAHVVGYGTTLVLGALALLRWRAMGSGGRS